MVDKNPSSVVRRKTYEQRIGQFIDKPLVKVLTGIRRSGKSTIMRMLAQRLLAEGIAPRRVLFLNMESLENVRYADFMALYTLVKERRAEVGEKLYLFIDEVQEVNSWERAVNSFLADELADIYISGSNSKLLAGELATYLSGRYVEFSVYPLVLSEFALFRNTAGQKTDDLFSEFLRVGGFPGIHRLEYSLETIAQYLASICDSVVLKDVVMRHRVRDVHLLERLLAYVSDNVGSIFSARSVADYFKNERRTLGVETIYNYLSYLEAACIAHQVSRFDLRGKRLLETHEKYYLADIGLRHALLGYRDSDINRYLENIVFIELKHRGYEVHIGKIDELEIDFIASKPNQRLYIQVAYLLSEKSTWEREMKPLRAIKDNYPKYVLTMDDLPEGDTDGIQRRYLPQFLMEAGW